MPYHNHFEVSLCKSAHACVSIDLKQNYVMDRDDLDYDLVWEIAHAQKPYYEIALRAVEVGKPGVADEMMRRAESIGNRAIRLREYDREYDEREQNRILEALRFRALSESTTDDILTFVDFKITDPAQAKEAWETILEIIKADPEFPLQVNEYDPGNFVLTGDVKAALEKITDPSLIKILTELDVALEETWRKQRPTLEA